VAKEIAHKAAVPVHPGNLGSWLALLKKLGGHSATLSSTTKARESLSEGIRLFKSSDEGGHLSQQV
jgi:hypothetical protein